MNGPSSTAVPSSAAPGDARLVAAPLRRRMAAFVYEGILLFGIVFATALVYGVATRQTNAMEHRSGLIAACFLVLGLYFVGTWTHGGQTLAMKTWHLRVATDTGAALPPWRALMRYLASWVWVLPPLAFASAALPRSTTAYFGALGAWVVLYALSALLHPRRQFWHDALCNTAIVLKPPFVRT
jgi:uncharacterized RDD family membrane protein YckC